MQIGKWISFSLDDVGLNGGFRRNAPPRINAMVRFSRSFEFSQLQEWNAVLPEYRQKCQYYFAGFFEAVAASAPPIARFRVSG
jgi:hypothetical protein